MITSTDQALAELSLCTLVDRYRLRCTAIRLGTGEFSNNVRKRAEVTRELTHRGLTELVDALKCEHQVQLAVLNHAVTSDHRCALRQARSLIRRTLATAGDSRREVDGG